jgi:kynurenine formamidase
MGHPATDTTASPDRPLPSFEALPLLDDTGLRHAWNVLDHDLGTIGLLTADRVARATALVERGETYCLNLPVNLPDPPFFGREAVRHTVFSVGRNVLDERLDAFHPQGSSQWDGLRHVRAREFGFFGGHTEDFEDGPGPLGIEHWAQKGIVGRGVLVDVERFRRAGVPLDPFAGEAIDAAELREVVAAQGVELEPGDILCVRTGWVAGYRALDDAGRVELAEEPRSSGLRADEDMARWLWDSHFAAVCLDNPAVEPIPGDPAVGSLHRRLLPMLGFALAELLDFERLATACASDGRWDFLFVAVPIHLPGGVGSPSNAVAVR